MEKQVTVFLIYPNDRGGTQIYDNVDVTSYGKDSISFSKREEHGDQVKVTDYTSNLPYVIAETITGPKSLL
jgi:hypothetical protein